MAEASLPTKLPWLGLEIPFTGGDVVEVPMAEKVSAATFLPAAVNYFGLGVFLTGFTTLMSSWDRYRWRTIGITVGFYVVSTILELVGLAIDGFAWVKWTTFFSAYEPVRFVSEAVVHPERQWAWVVRDGGGAFLDLGPLGYDAILVGAGILCLMTAQIVFCRRDLPAPM